jgi:hypothetical protein
VIIRNSVVLPAPFGPMTPTMPPGGSLKVRSSISSGRHRPFEAFGLDHHVAQPLAGGMTICVLAGTRSPAAFTNSS